MTDESDLAYGAGEVAGLRVRVNRLEAAQRRLLAIMIGLATAFAFGAVWLVLIISTRGGLERHDTVTARRFIVEANGRRHAELGMHELGFGQLLLGPDDRDEAGVAIYERGQLHMRRGARDGISVLGSELLLSRGGRILGGFGLFKDDSLWWQFSSTGTRPVVFGHDRRMPDAFLDTLVRVRIR